MWSSMAFVCSCHFSLWCYINGGYNTVFADHMKLIDGTVPALKDAGHELHAVSDLGQMAMFFWQSAHMCIIWNGVLSFCVEISVQLYLSYFFMWTNYVLFEDTKCAVLLYDGRFNKELNDAIKDIFLTIWLAQNVLQN